MHYLALRAGIKISRFEKTSKLKEETQSFGNICGFEEQSQLSATKMSFILLFLRHISRFTFTPTLLKLIFFLKETNKLLAKLKVSANPKLELPEIGPISKPALDLGSRKVKCVF